MFFMREKKEKKQLQVGKSVLQDDVENQIEPRTY